MKIIRKITDYDIIGQMDICAVKPKISVRAVLVDEASRIALVYVKSKNAYTIPGGGVEGKESLKEGLVREMYEETGCNFTLLGEIGIVYENRAQHNFTHINHYYLAQVIGEKKLPRFTASEIRNGCEIVWVNYIECYTAICEQVINDYQFKFIRERDKTVLQYLLMGDEAVCVKFREIMQIALKG